MDPKFTYSEKYIIKSSDVDINQELKISSLMMMFQNLSVMGAEICDVGKDKTLDQGFIWVFSKLKFDIKRMPKYLEEVCLYTYPNKLMHFIYPRTFEIKDLDGNLLVKATSLWCLIDINERKIIMPSQLNLSVETNDLADPIEKIIPKEVTLKEERIVRYSDIDVNRHLNNVKYFDFISDLYDSKFFFNNRIKKVNIVFHKEVKENDVLKIYASNDNTYYQFKLDNKTIFECNVDYFSDAN